MSEKLRNLIHAYAAAATAQGQTPSVFDIFDAETDAEASAAEAEQRIAQPAQTYVFGSHCDPVRPARSRNGGRPRGLLAAIRA